MHPILDCPADVLKYIFEEATRTWFNGPDTFKTALSISHVSQRWRMVALDIPKMWTTLRCSLDQDTPEERMRLEGRWDMICSRVRYAPAYIMIDNIGYEGGLSLSHCRLSEIHAFNALCLDFAGSQWKEEVDRLAFASDCHIEWLQLDVESGISSGTIDFSLLRKFPPITSILIRDCAHVRSSTPHTFPSVKDIDTGIGVETDVIGAFLAFPNLENAEFQEIYFEPYSGPHITMRRLNQLHVYWMTSSDWLSSVSCPVLTCLSLDHLVRVQDVLGFISRHPSIKRLKFEYPEALDQLAKLVPKLEHLTFEQINGQPPDGLYYPYFPVLQTLTIEDTHDSLTCKGFEKLVRARCLPRSHPKSQLPAGAKPLDSISIKVSLEMYEDAEEGLSLAWTESELYKEARKDISDDSVEQTWCLWWE